MTAKLKLGTRDFALIFSAANLLLFLMYFVPYYVLEGEGATVAYEYFRIYIDEILNWMLPIATAAVIVIRCGKESIKKTLITAILLSLPNLVYTLPFYYLLGIEYGGDTPESLLMSLLVSLGYILIFFIHILVLFFIIKSSVIFFTAKEFEKELPEMYKLSPTAEMRRDCRKKASTVFYDKLYDGKALDLSKPAPLAFFFAALFEFTAHFILESADAASYLIDYVGSYRGAEIIYMIFRFVFLLIMMFVSLAAAQLVKRHTKATEGTDKISE